MRLHHEQINSISELLKSRVVQGYGVAAVGSAVELTALALDNEQLAAGGFGLLFASAAILGREGWKQAKAQDEQEAEAD